jgi:hypothetical protein
MTEDELAALVCQDIDGVNAFASDDASRRDKALEYAEGVMKDVPSKEGYSKVVSRDVADTLGLIKPGLNRVFFGSERIAEYEPTRQQIEKDPKTGKDRDLSEDRADQATDYINYVTMKECDGYRHLNSAFHDGLLHGNGIIKHWWDPSKEYSTEEFTGLTQMAYEDLVADPEVEEVLEHSEYPDPSSGGDQSSPGMGQGGYAAGADAGGQEPYPGAGIDAPVAGMPLQAPPGAPPAGMGGLPPALGMGHNQPPALLHDVKIKRVCSYGRLRLKALAPEHFRIDRDATVLDEESCKFAAHVYRDTRSALIKQYPKKKELIKEAPRAALKTTDNSASDSRDKDGVFSTGDEDGHTATELVDVYECYRLVDYDGDGIAEWRKVVMVGKPGNRNILENEEWGDDLPFSDIVPEPVPHRWRGRSIFDEIEDVQQIKTVLKRQLLDNTYLSNNPRQIAILDAIKNPDVLANWKISDTLFVSQQDALRFEAIPNIAPNVFPVLEYMDQVIEKRTGVSMSSMAMDMDKLQNQTATATNAMEAARHTKVEEYARNIAEGGMRRIFRSCLRLHVKHQDKPRTIRLRGEWVEMDPRSWHAEMNVTINTGLGSGSRDRDLQLLMGIAAKQELVHQVFGPQVAHKLGVGPNVIFDTYRMMVEAAGIRSPERFFPELSKEEIDAIAAEAMKNQPQDPKMLQIQAQAQIEQQKLQAQQQMEAAKLQAQQQVEAQKAAQEQQFRQMEFESTQRSEQMKLEREAMIEERQAQADIAVKEREAAAKAALEQQKFAFQKELEVLKFELERELKHADMQMKQQDMQFRVEERQFTAETSARQRDDELHLRRQEKELAPEVAEREKQRDAMLQELHAHVTKPKGKRTLVRENGRLTGAMDENGEMVARLIRDPKTGQAVEIH